MKNASAVDLRCGSCRSKSFEYDNANLAHGITCARCGKRYTQESLEFVNKALLETEAKKLAELAVKDVQKKLQSRFKSLKIRL